MAGCSVAVSLLISSRISCLSDATSSSISNAGTGTGSSAGSGSETGSSCRVTCGSGSSLLSVFIRILDMISSSSGMLSSGISISSTSLAATSLKVILPNEGFVFSPLPARASASSILISEKLSLLFFSFSSITSLTASAMRRSARLDSCSARLSPIKFSQFSSPPGSSKYPLICASFSKISTMVSDTPTWNDERLVGLMIVNAWPLGAERICSCSISLMPPAFS